MLWQQVEKLLQCMFTQISLSIQSVHAEILKMKGFQVN